MQVEESDSRQIKFLKVMFIGDSGVGKTSALMKMTGGGFSGVAPSTIGVDFRWLSYKMPLRPEPLSLRFWDTAGQERFRSLTSTYLRSADAIILCFDANCRESLEGLDEWVRDVEEAQFDLSRLIVVGCKDDLPLKADLTHSILSRFPWTTVSAKNDSPEDIQKKILPLLHPTFSSLLDTWIHVASPLRLQRSKRKRRKCC